MTLRHAPHVESGLGVAAFLQFFFSVLLMVAIPKAATISLGVLLFGSIIVILIHSFSQSTNFWVPPKRGLWLILLPLLVAASSSWSEDPKIALVAAAALAFVLMAQMIILRATTMMAEPVIRGCQYGFMVGVSLAVVLAAIDVASGQGLTKIVFGIWPDLPEAATRHVVIEDGEAIFVSEASPNRRAIILVCLLPAFLYLGFQKRPNSPALFWVILGAVGYVGLLVNTHSMTAQVAFVAGLLSFMISKHWDRMTKPVLTTAWAAVWIFVVPAAILLADIRLQDSKFLPPSAAARVNIWSSVAESAIEKPILGHGVGSRAPRKVDGQTADQSSTQPYIFHPHNGYLQIWHELGLVGALMFFAGGAWLLQAIGAQSSRIRPYMYATFAIGACIMLTGYGFWQHWHLSAFALGAAFLWIAIQDEQSDERPRTPWA